MTPTIFRDARLRAIVWRDLVRVGPREVIVELLLPAGALLLSLWLAGTGIYPLALGASFLFFLIGLRIVHNAFHGALGLPGWATDLVLWVMSAVMLGSMHAVRFNHLRHHAHLLDEEDLEGRSATMSAPAALAFGPAFPVLLHATAWKHGGARLRRMIAGQLAVNGLSLGLVFGVLRIPVLEYHLAAMAFGHCLTAFFAVWTVHHHCDREHFIARTLRNRIKNALTFNMFLHIEHHLYPRVPTCHLPRLSARIDLAAPELKRNLVF